MLLFKTCLFIALGKIYDKSTKKNKLKTIAPVRNDEFELPDGFYSGSANQHYIE